MAFGSSPKRLVYAYDAAGNRVARFLRLGVSSKELRSLPKYEERADSLPEANFVQESLAGQQVRLYPNPTQGQLTLECLEELQGKTVFVEIFDVQGRRIISLPMTSSRLVLDLTTQPSGIYLMLLRIDKALSTWKIYKL